MGPSSSAEEYPGPDCNAQFDSSLYMSQTWVKRAIIALYHNIICTNAHNKQKLTDIDISVPSTLKLGYLSPPGSTPITTFTPLAALQCLDHISW